MFRHPEFVMLHMQKAAGSHVINLLEELYPSGERGVNHGPILPGDVGRFVFCGIRNPWDFYVSLFHYSKQTESPPFLPYHVRPELWDRTYGNPDKAEGFREWLAFLLSGQCWSRGCSMIPTRWMSKGTPRGIVRLGEGIDGLLNEKPTHELGLLTLWLCRLAIPGYRRQRFASGEALLARFHEVGTIDDYYRMESLGPDILRIVTDHLPEPEVENWRAIVGEWSEAKTNTSRRPKDYSAYYTPELVELVAQRDAWIIERFGYEFGGAG